MAFGKITAPGITTIKAGWEAFNQLITDLLSTANGKGASQVGVEDSGGNFAGANVEAVLAEIQGDLDTVSDLSEVLNEDADTTTGLTWGFKSGRVLLEGVVYTIAAGTVLLADDDVSYVEIDPADQTVKGNTTGFTTGSTPLRQVTCASGAQTVSTDKRAFLYGHHTGDAESLTDHASANDIIDSQLTAVDATGTGNEPDMDLPVNIGAYTDYQRFQFRAAGQNTTSVDLNVDALGDKNIVDASGAELFGGQIRDNQLVDVIYDADNDNFVVQNIPSPIIPSFNVRLNGGAQTITTGSWDTVVFDTDTADPYSWNTTDVGCTTDWYDTTTGFFTIPAGAYGVYQLNFQLYFSTVPSTNYDVRIHNGAAQLGIGTGLTSETFSYSMTIHAVASNNVFRIQVQAYGSSAVLGVGGGFDTQFSGFMVNKIL